MDNFINLAALSAAPDNSVKLAAQADQQTQVGIPPNESGKSALGHINFEEILTKLIQSDTSNAHLYANTIQMLMGTNLKEELSKPVDKEIINKAHTEAYAEGASNVDAKTLGTAAAWEAFTKFTQSGEINSSVTELVSSALIEASSSKFDQVTAGGVGNKQDAINVAGLTALKLFAEQSA